MREPPKPIRVLLVDDHPVVLDALSLLVASQPDMRVAAVARPGKDAFRTLQKSKPDVLIIVFLTLDAAGLEMVRQFKIASPECRILLFTAETDHSLLVDAVRLNVEGVVSKMVSTELFLKSIRKVGGGELWISRELLADAARTNSKAELVGSLTERENEVVQLIRVGLSNKEIASRLEINVLTVKRHLTNIFSKLKLDSRMQLALLSTKNDLRAM